MQRFQDRVAVITGAAGGIGRATALRLSEEGATVIAVDLDEEGGGSVAEATGGAFIRADVTDEAAVEALFARVRGEYGSVDVAFNNAGISPPDDDSILTTSLDTWRRVQEVNLTSVYLCCKYALPHMRAQGKGAIVNTASAAAYIGEPTRPAYAVTKAYGVFNEDMIGLKGIARRAVFVLDRQGVVRFRQVLEEVLTHVETADDDMSVWQAALSTLQQGAQALLDAAGRPAALPSTHGGLANGLQAEALGNEACYEFVRAHRRTFRCGANEVPDVDGATREIERYLKRGAVMIAEQKFGVACDSPEMQQIYALARAYEVPVLMHWQFNMYNHGFERFHKVLEKFPGVKFVGHAQTWWANIDGNYTDQTVLYPRGPVTPGGLTDRYLSDYPNMYGDLSARSGLNALTRDETFTRDFLMRYRDKLLFGSDWPHGTFDPMIGLHVAVTRTDPDGQGDAWNPAERLALQAAIDAYTSSAAWASFDEQRKGTITRGMLADIVVLTEDIFASPASLVTAKVAVTIFDGKIVYRRGVKRTNP